MISENKAKETYRLFLKDNSIEKVMTTMGLSSSTVERYIRHAKSNQRSYMPKILVFDIETSRIKVDVWGLYKQRIPHTSIDKDWFIICWSAKWLFGSDVMNDKVTPEEALIRNDKRVVESLCKAIDEADIVIAHNGDKFDIRKFNSRCLFWKIPQPSPYRSIDTLKSTQRAFGLTSHKLDYIAQFLFNKEKFVRIGESAFEVWRTFSGASERIVVYMLNQEF